MAANMEPPCGAACGKMTFRPQLTRHDLQSQVALLISLSSEMGKHCAGFTGLVVQKEKKSNGDSDFTGFAEPRAG